MEGVFFNDMRNLSFAYQFFVPIYFGIQSIKYSLREALSCTIS